MNEVPTGVYSRFKVVFLGIFQSQVSKQCMPLTFEKCSSVPTFFYTLSLLLLWFSCLLISEVWVCASSENAKKYTEERWA